MAEVVDEKPLTKEDMVDFLNDESVPEDSEEKENILEVKPDKKESDDKEEEEQEEELKLDDEVNLEVPVPIKAITKKYPEIFKDFPYLKKAYYREQEYTEIFPTVDDARDSVERAKQLDQFESQLIKGDSTSILRAVKESDQDAFGKLVDEYLPNLMKVDQNAYFHVIGNVFKSAIVSMANEAKTSDNEQLNIAAQILHQFLFGNSKFTAPSNFGKPATSENDELKKERAEFINQKFEMARDDLSSRVENSVKSTIEVNIDPKGSMSDYVKKNAVRDVWEALETAIKNDTQYRGINDKLWTNAYESNFSKDSLDKIRSTYLTKAKMLLPQLISNARNNALKGSGVKLGGNSESKDKKGPLPVGRTASAQSSSKSSKPVPKGMSTFDYLMSED